MLARALLALTAFLSLLTATSQSAVIHVDASGGGDYLTIAEGTGAAALNDTVLVAPGTYTGALNRGINAFDLTLVSEGGSGVTTVDCEGEAFAFQLYRSNLDGFTITHSRGAVNNGYAAVFATGSSITECVFDDNPGVCLLTYGENHVTDCTFLENDGWGALLERGEGSVRGCLFEGSGLSFYDEWYGGYHPEVQVIDCVFTGINGTALGVSHESPSIEGCLFVGNGCAIDLNNSFSMIHDCTIVLNNSTSRGALHFSIEGHSGLTNHCTTENCIIAFNSCLGSVTGVPDASEFDASCFFGNVGGDSLVQPDPLRSNIFEDPLFCDLAGGDFTLCANSPCLAENEPVGTAMGVYSGAPGCDPCGSPVRPASWGAIKALFIGER